MNPVLHAVSRLLDSPAGQTGGLSPAELADSLSGETRLRLATRLALVKLSARCGQRAPTPLTIPRACTSCTPWLARRLERLATVGDEEALAGLVELAPELRELEETLAREGSPLVVLPRALLELLQARLH